MYEDREGGLWVGTVETGAVRLRDGSATTFGRNQGLPGDVVRALLQDRSGRFFVGLDGSGLVVRAPNGTFTTDPALDRLRTASIRALYDDRAGGVLIGSNDGLFRLPERRVDAGAPPIVPALAEHPESCPRSAGPPVGRHQPRPRAARGHRMHAGQPGVERVAGRSSPRSIRTSRTPCGSARWPVD